MLDQHSQENHEPEGPGRTNIINQTSPAVIQQRRRAQETFLIDRNLQESKPFLNDVEHVCFRRQVFYSEDELRWVASILWEPLCVWVRLVAFGSIIIFRTLKIKSDVAAERFSLVMVLGWRRVMRARCDDAHHILNRIWKRIRFCWCRTGMIMRKTAIRRQRKNTMVWMIMPKGKRSELQGLEAYILSIIQQIYTANPRVSLSLSLISQWLFFFIGKPQKLWQTHLRRVDRKTNHNKGKGNDKILLWLLTILTEELPLPFYP